MRIAADDVFEPGLVLLGAVVHVARRLLAGGAKGVQQALGHPGVLIQDLLANHKGVAHGVDVRSMEEGLSLLLPFVAEDFAHVWPGLHIWVEASVDLPALSISIGLLREAGSGTRWISNLGGAPSPSGSASAVNQWMLFKSTPYCSQVGLSSRSGT